MIHVAVVAIQQAGKRAIAAESIQQGQRLYQAKLANHPQQNILINVTILTHAAVPDCSGLQVACAQTYMTGKTWPGNS